MSRIKSIQVVGGNSYHLGDNRYGHSLPIGEIKDKSIEYPDHIYFIYQIFNTDGELMAELINCPVEVEYEDEAPVTTNTAIRDDVPF